MEKQPERKITKIDAICIVIMLASLLVASLTINYIMELQSESSVTVILKLDLKNANGTLIQTQTLKGDYIQMWYSYIDALAYGRTLTNSPYSMGDVNGTFFTPHSPVEINGTKALCRIGIGSGSATNLLLTNLYTPLATVSPTSVVTSMINTKTNVTIISLFTFASGYTITEVGYSILLMDNSGNWHNVLVFYDQPSSVTVLTGDALTVTYIEEYN
jgi:hypothetical protein